MAWDAAQQERQRKWRNANREKLRAQGRARYAKNKERLAAEALARYWKNPERGRAATKRWREKNRGKRAVYARKNSARHNYGLTFEEFEQLCRQHPTCAICGAMPNGRDLDVDHCHKTGKVRARLCSRCNRLLGLMESVGYVIVRRIEEYLKQHASDFASATTSLRNSGT